VERAQSWELNLKLTTTHIGTQPSSVFGGEKAVKDAGGVDMGALRLRQGMWGGEPFFAAWGEEGGGSISSHVGKMRKGHKLRDGERSVHLVCPTIKSPMEGWEREISQKREARVKYVRFMGKNSSKRLFKILHKGDGRGEGRPAKKAESTK